MSWAILKKYGKKRASIEPDRVSWMMDHEDNEFDDLRKIWDDLYGLLFLLKIFPIELDFTLKHESA